MNTPCTTDEEFIERHWEREATSQVGFGSFRGPDREAVFEAAVKFCEQDPDGARFYVGSELQFKLTGRPLLPKREDRDFETYDRRVVETLGHKNYTLAINNLQLGSPSLHRWARGITRSVFKHRGMNQGGAGVALFVGNYEYSAFPVHFDHENIMHFPLLGTKKLRTWSRDYIDANPEIDHTRDYSAHLDGSKLLQGEQGDVLYWPKHAWHVGEASDGLCVSVALGMSSYHSPLLPLISKLSSMGVGPMDANGSASLPDSEPTPPIAVDLNKPQNSADSLPSSFEGAWQQLQQMLSPAAIYHVWLGLLSSDGMGPVQKAEPLGVVDPGDRLQYMAPSTVVHKQLEGMPPMVAMNGQVLFDPELAELTVSIADTIAQQGEVSVEFLQERFAASSEGLVPVLERLYAADVVRRAPTAEPVQPR